MPLMTGSGDLGLIKQSRQQKGVALFEILIAVFVLSIGLLGIAGLQSAGLKNGNSAFLKTEATFLAMDIMERMRANPDGVAGGNYDIDTVAFSYSAPGCSFSACNAAQRPALDAYEWEDAVASRLPGGEGIVEEIAATPGLFLVTVMWDDERRGATGAASKDCGGDRDNDLTCFQMLFQPQS